MRHGQPTLPAASSSDDLTAPADLTLFHCPSAASSSSHAPPTLARPPLLCAVASSSCDATLATGVDEAVVALTDALTPRLGWRLDTRPAVHEEVMVLTLNSRPLGQAEAAAGEERSKAVGDKGRRAPELSIDTDEADDTVNALLSSLLSSGLSPNRRFSYPPTSHTLASLPTQPHLTHTTSTSSTSFDSSTSSSSSASAAAAASACAAGPLRSVSPALMSPLAASTFFQTLDRKRAFKPYYRTPHFTASSVHRVQLSLSLLHPTAASPRLRPQGLYTAAVYAVDAASASVGLVGYERVSGGLGGCGAGVWCWQIGMATCMVMCSLLLREEADDCLEGEVGETRLWTGYFSVQQLLKDRTLTIKGSEWDGREEVKVEVHTVQSLQIDDEHDRGTLRQYEHECPMLREALHRSAGTVNQGAKKVQQARKVRLVADVGEAGEVKF